MCQWSSSSKDHRLGPRSGESATLDNSIAISCASSGIGRTRALHMDRLPDWIIATQLPGSD
jgi:hypothetical protein